VIKKGYIYATISAILFGTAGIFVKLSYETGLNSINLLTFQYIIAVTLMFNMAFIKNKDMLHISRIELVHLIILGVVGNTLMTVFYYKAFEYLPVAVVTMLLYTSPIIIALYTWLFRKGKFEIRKVIAIGIAFCGCLLTLNILFGHFTFSRKGIIFGLLSAIFYSFMNLYSEKHLNDVNSLAINAYSTLFSLIVLIIYNPPRFIFTNGITYKSIEYTVILAMFCEIIPLTLLYSAIKLVGAVKVSIISNLEIPTAMLLSIFLLRENISLAQIIGAIFIIYAIYLVRDGAE
jgi:drug/metabolite transporter (DMT)-like permease